MFNSLKGAVPKGLNWGQGAKAEAEDEAKPVRAEVVKDQGEIQSVEKSATVVEGAGGVGGVVAPPLALGAAPSSSGAGVSGGAAEGARDGVAKGLEGENKMGR